MAQAQTTKKKDKKTKPSVATAGTSTPSTRADLLAAFKKKAVPAAKGAAKGKPVLKLSQEDQDRIAEYAPLKELFDIIEARKSREAADINTSVFTESWVPFLWKAKRMPTTPKFQVRGENGKVDIEGQYQVSQGSKISLRFPDVGEDEDPREVYVDTLVAAGLDRSDAEQFVDAEIDFTPTWTLKFTDLMVQEDEDDPGRVAAEKVFLWLQGADKDSPLTLSTEEREALAEHVNGGVVQKSNLTGASNLLDRVCDYVGNEDQLQSLLAIVRPQAFMTRVKFGVSDSEGHKNERLLEQAAEIMGVELGKEGEQDE